MSARLFLQVVATEARTRMSYRVDFWVSAVVTFLVELGLVWFLWVAVYAESGADRIGGYGRDAMVLYSIAVVLLGRLVRGPEFGGGAISQEIYDGTLSRYLVYPVPYLGLKYAQSLGSLLPGLVHLLVFGAATFLLFPVPAETPLTPASAAMGLVAAAFANVLYFLMAWPIQAVAFWADNVWSLTVAQRIATSLLGGALFPLSVLPAAAGDVLAWLPFRWLYAFPVECFLGRVDVGDWVRGLAATVAWSLVLGVLGGAVWRRGGLRYTGVGI